MSCMYHMISCDAVASVVVSLLSAGCESFSIAMVLSDESTNSGIILLNVSATMIKPDDES